MKKKHAIFATLIILAIAGGVYVRKTREIPTIPDETSKGSFVKFEISSEWKPETIIEPAKLIPAQVSGAPKPKEPIQIWRVESDAPIILKGTASPDIEKIEVTWLTISTGGYMGRIDASEKDRVTLSVENFTPGDTTWEFKAELYRNLYPGNSVNQYTVVGLTSKSKKSYDHILFIKIQTDPDRAYIKSQQDVMNKPIIEGAQEFAGDFERYTTQSTQGNRASTTITDTISAHVFYYNPEYCKKNSMTFLEMTKNCSEYLGGFVVVYDSEKRQNHYIGLYERLYGTQSEPDLAYDSKTNSLLIGYIKGVEAAALGANPVRPAVLDTIDLSYILNN